MADYHDPHLEDEMLFVMIKLMRHRGCWCCHCCCCCQNWSWCCSCWQWSRRSGTAETLEFGISIHAWDWKWTFARQHHGTDCRHLFSSIRWLIPPDRSIQSSLRGPFMSVIYNPLMTLTYTMISALNRLPLLIGEMQRWIGCVPDQYAPMLGLNEFTNGICPSIWDALYGGGGGVFVGDRVVGVLDGWIIEWMVHRGMDWFWTSIFCSTLIAEC